MHRRKEFLIGSLIGLCIMLVALLAAVVAPRPRAALAQDTPSASISLGEFSVRQGDGTMLAATLKNLPNDPNNPRSFPAYTYRFDLERKVGEEWENADNCELSPVGQTKNIHPVYNAWKDIVYSNNGLSIPEDCPIGPYRVKFVLKDEHNAEFVSDKREFTVLLGPSVTIEMPAGPHYRGTSIDATIKFHELIQGASYTYEAYVMNDNPNYADNCEGTGLARNEIFSLGSVDENPEVRTGTITSSCPKENYDLTVRLFNAENRIKATKSEVFNITTNPAAIPSVSVAMSEASPVTPGTEFDVIFNFYDLQDDTAIRYLDTLTNTGTNQPVGGMDCGGSLVGWGQDVSATVIRNPIVNRVTITSDCPVGSYRLKSVIQDNSGNEIISGSIDFDIGDPDLTPTAPSVLNFTAKQNSYFSQQLPTGSGGDGTLSYGATGLPAGLSFNSSTRTIAGTPSGHGIATVTYTVTDADGDPDSVQFTITVAQDFFPSPPVILNFTGRVGRYFEQQISRGTGDDLPLSFSVTDLPDGLDFFQDTHMITGTPTKQQSPTVTYTVRDGDQDEERTTFTIEVSANNTPTLDNLSTTTYPARVGVLFTKKLPAGSGGDGDLVHTATNLPDGLTFDQGTQTVTGRPTTVESRTVTYTVQDEDQDEASTTFMIEVSVNNTPTLDNLSTTTYPARVGVLFTKKLPAGSGGDGDLVHTATNLPDGLTFDQGTQTVTGRPTTVESKTVTYAVRDEDQDEAGTTFTIEVSVNNTPTLDNLSTTTYPARVGVLFTKKLPAGSGGDGDLVHTATNLPDGLTFDQGTQTVTGRPTTVESKTVTYAVRDEDQDEAGTTFTIEVSVNNTPTLDNLSTTTYPARVGVLFTKKLPAGSGGDGDLVHTATNLPDGLTFDQGTQTVTGRPTTVESKTVTYAVRDEDQDEAGTTFTIEVSVNNTPTLDNLSTTTYPARVGVLFTKKLPAGSGGDGDLVHTATNLPDGLTFDQGTQTVTGRPTTVESKTVTYAVRDEDQDEAGTTFTIEVSVNNTPTLDNLSTTTYPARVGVLFTKKLPAGSGGDGDLVHTATNLPDGLTFDQGTQTVTGRPTTVESKTVTYAVRDEDQDEASTTFTISVVANLTPTMESIDDTSAKLTKVFTLQLPAGSGGDGELEHDLTGLPDGLTFVPSSRTITGTPTSAKDFEVTYTATDEDNDEARQTFHIVVYALPSLREVADAMATKDEVFTLVLTAVSGGKEPFDHTVTGLPTGLSFDKPSLTITGTPTQVQVADVTFAVEDDDGDTASEEFQISVSEGDTNPSFSYTIPDFTLRVNSPFTVLLPGATGGNAPYNW